MFERARGWRRRALEKKMIRAKIETLVIDPSNEIAGKTYAFGIVGASVGEEHGTDWRGSSCRQSACCSPGSGE